MNVISVNNREIDELNKARNEEIEAEKARQEQARADKIAALEKLSPAEYIAYRQGMPAPMSSEDLGKLSMKEYIESRKKQKKRS